MMVRLAVFDCDGTLSDGQAAVCTAMEHAFCQVGLPVPHRAAVRRIVGLSLPQAVATLAPELAPDVRASVVDAYKSAFRQARYDGSLHEPLYEGITDLLQHLRQRGWMLGVATGKSDRGVKSCLASHGVFDLFVTLQTADRHPSKPHPSMIEQAMAEAGASVASTVMIGDTTFDMEMARAAGVRAVGVAWGYHEPAELIATGAQAVATTPAELEAMLDG